MMISSVELYMMVTSVELYTLMPFLLTDLFLRSL